MMRTPWLKSGMTAILTGASSGIGKRVSERLQAEGVKVAAFSRHPEKIEKTPLCLPLECDVSDTVSVQRAVASTVSAFGGIDILVNAAGVSMPKYMGIEKVDPSLWTRIVQTNLTGVFNMCHFAMPHLLTRHGYIVNIFSTAAHRSVSGNAPYSASKRGALAISDTVALEGEASGLRVCSICPGAVDTPIWDKKELPPDEATRRAMLDTDDIADILMSVLTLPGHVRVESVIVTPAPGMQRES